MSGHSTITTHAILEAIRLFRWVSRRQLFIYFLGKVRRSKVLEFELPAIERDGRANVTFHRREKVYSPVRKNQTSAVSIEHELGATEGLVRIWRCRMGESEIIPERRFRGFAIVPEFGVRFSDERGSGILFEYSTNANFNHRSGVVKSKLTRYTKHLPAIEDRFERDFTVLFVIDAPRIRVKEFVGLMEPILREPITSGLSGEPRYPFFFTDHEAFLKVPVGKALKTKIYFWHDGKEYPLTNHD